MFGSGYLANAGIIPALIGRDGLVLIDELSHACIYAGAQLSRGRVLAFRHNDVAHARELLAAHRARTRPRADRHRRRVLHGRRSGAARRVAGARATSTTPG